MVFLALADGRRVVFALLVFVANALRMSAGRAAAAALMLRQGIDKGSAM
jgi:hypothetical protein